MRRKTRPHTWIAALLAAAIPFLISACADPQNDKAPQAEAKEIVTPTGLKYLDLKVGEGPEATSGKNVEVHYTGWLENRHKFASSLDRQEPFTFRLGAGEVIQGWDQGVAGMKVGGKRKLIIPPDLGYGEQGAGGAISPPGTPTFDGALLGVGERRVARCA